MYAVGGGVDGDGGGSRKVLKFSCFVVKGAATQTDANPHIHVYIYTYIHTYTYIYIYIYIYAWLY